MHERPTIVDVARVAGVAVSTASYALNDKGRVSAATRDRVLDAAKTLGFRPHRAARGLPSGMTMSIGLRFGHDTTVPAGGFFVDLLAGAAEAANAAGYGLQITAATVDESSVVDGLIVVDPSSARVARALGGREIPVVTIGRVGGRASGIPWVDVDHRQAMDGLLDFLARRAGDGPAWMVSLPQRLPFIRDLEASFEDWCRGAGRIASVVRVPDHPLPAADRVREALDAGPPPALIVTALDRQAVGVHHALLERGKVIPLGCASDDDILAVLSPPVPGVALGGRAHGHAAVTMTLDWIRSGERPAPLLLPAELVVRGATAEPVPGPSRAS